MAEKDQVLASVLLGDVNPFLNLLQSFMSSSNEDRGKAEKIYETCKEFPDELVYRLLEVLKKSEHLEMSGLSAILLRKLISKDEIFTKLSPPALNTLKSQLLEIVYHDGKISLSKKLADTVGELGQSLLRLEPGAWPELLPGVFQWVSGADDRLRECALLILGQMSSHVIANAGPHLASLVAVLQQCLTSSSNGDIRIAAVKTTAEFVFDAESKDVKSSLQSLLPGMVHALTVELNAKNESAAQEVLEVFVSIADADPKFLKKQLGEVVTVMLQIAEAAELEEDTRHLAVEFLVTLIDARDKAPGMMKKVPNVVGRIFALLLTLLLNIEDKPEWYTATNEDEDDFEGDYEFAKECLDRMAIALQGNIIVPLASQFLPQFLSDADWKKRHAALMALGQIAEGCSKVMLKSVETVVNMALTSFRDPHPRVRYAAINAMAQLSLDLVPEIQKNHHQSVLPALIMSMEETNFPRIQAHAVAALLNFSEGAPEEAMRPYMDALVSRLLALLQTGGVLVQEGAVTALAALADNAQEQFVKYYDSVMPFLKTILVTFNEKERRMLRSKAIECISLVGMAVGKDKFRGDAKEVIDVLIQLQGTKMEDDDPLASYMLQAWTRLCKCLGQEFLPLMSVVMPTLYRAASLKPDVNIVDSDEEPDEDDDDLEVIAIGKQRVIIRTSVLEEKATACSMVCCYAEELKEGFFPWVEEVSQLMVPLLKFYFHEDVRKAAMQAIPLLLVSTKSAIEKGTANKEAPYLKELFDYLIGPVTELLPKEPEAEVLVDLLEALNDSIKSCGELLTADQVKKIVDNLKEVTKESRSRRQYRLSRYEADELDEEERTMADEENEVENEVYEEVGEIIGSLIKVLKESFVPFFEDLVPYMLPLLQKGVSDVERRVTICIFDDAAEVYKSHAIKYYDAFLPAVLDACTDPDADIRQSAAYGLGVCAEFGGPAFRPIAQEALTRLTAVVSQPDSRGPESESASDNAISAIGKICEFQPDGLNTGPILAGWLNYLPVKKDVEEAKLVHRQLCTLLERGDARLLGPNYQNLPKILSVFADVLSAGTTLASEETVARIKALLQSMQQSIGQDVLAQAWGTLKPQQQASLQS